MMYFDNLEMNKTEIYGSIAMKQLI